MSEAEGKSTALNGKGSVQEHKRLFAPTATVRAATLNMQSATSNVVVLVFSLFLPGGEKEDQHKETDASGSKDGETQSSSQDGKHTHTHTIPSCRLLTKL